VQVLLLPPSANSPPPPPTAISSSSADSDPAAQLAKELHDRKELSDEMEETVAALKEEIKVNQ
jgi:hypothetical protein